MDTVLRLNEKSQIVISKKIRRLLGLKPGDELAAVVEGEKIILRPKPRSPTERLRGLAKGTWGDRRKIDTYIDKLRDEWRETWTSTLSMISVDETIAEAAALIRARYTLRLPDALQVAAAIKGEATLFITNDGRFKKVKGIETVVLEDYVRR
jgi:AbrB family looped-hinge helix DNA binding protein